jgi:hypothetical protein
MVRSITFIFLQSIVNVPLTTTVPDPYYLIPQVDGLAFPGRPRKAINRAPLQHAINHFNDSDRSIDADRLCYM